MRYATRQDAIAQNIRPALDPFGGQFDADAICQAAFAWKGDGFEQVVSEPEFWKIVQENAIS